MSQALMALASEGVGAIAAVGDRALPSWLSELGAPGLLALTIILVLTGRLVPVGTVRRIERDRDAYRDAGEVKDQTIKELAEGSLVTRDVLLALQKLASQKDADR